MNWRQEYDPPCNEPLAKTPARLVGLLRCATGSKQNLNVISFLWSKSTRESQCRFFYSYPFTVSDFLSVQVFLFIAVLLLSFFSSLSIRPLIFFFIFLLILRCIFSPSVHFLNIFSQFLGVSERQHNSLCQGRNNSEKQIHFIS